MNTDGLRMATLGSVYSVHSVVQTTGVEPPSAQSARSEIRPDTSETGALLPDLRSLPVQNLKKEVVTKGLVRCPSRMIPATEPADKIIMQGVHVELMPALQTAIRNKFAVLLRHNEHIVRIHVRLQLEQTHGSQHLYSATAQIEIGGPDLVATMKGEEAYAVIDALAEKLSEQLRERHERRTDRHREGPKMDQAAP